MAVRLSQLPPEAVQQHNLAELARDGRVLVRVRKGIYGLSSTPTSPRFSATATAPSPS
eukprot:NODE_21260_length_255_cov_2.194175_g20091_i0.p4 GENE.NODE_21260_length_255_cov_2.194175_g20091_i0~~NODE_21260_length_255_cov_2.194175_g20091_i0.p4  ORF type:complete len:67 (+),score=13.07 NODE_21260_length_255_cov_2.194175_g20091_i0:28-201(+)